MASMSAVLWQTQQILHKNPQVVPGALLLLSSLLVVYRHAINDTQEHETDVIKKFLAMILLQMFPLVFLEMKIMSCADPVGLFCKFATPVTLQHAFFLGLRLILCTQFEILSLWSALLSFIGALVAMYKGYGQSLMSIIECSAVWGLISLCLVAAVCTVSLEDYIRPAEMSGMSWDFFLMSSFETASNYIEITAFVPAVWIVYHEDQTTSRWWIESPDTKRISTTFFLFLVGFYITEDVVSAYQVFEFSQLASLAHVAHFCLLMDFACYVLAHIYNPEKLVGELRRWLPVDFYHEV